MALSNVRMRDQDCIQYVYFSSFKRYIERGAAITLIKYLMWLHKTRTHKKTIVAVG